MRSQTLIVFTIAATVALATARPAAAAEPAEKQGRKRTLLVQLREIVKREPTVQEVQRAALAHYQLEPERIRSMSTSARIKGLFP